MRDDVRNWPSSEYLMVKDGPEWRPYHRVIMERVLERPLRPTEIVHHKNGNKHDNRSANLGIMNHSDHARLHVSGRIAGGASLKCLICGKRIRGRFGFCVQCLHDHGLYGLKYSEFPAWAKALKNMDQKERRYKKRDYNRLVCIDDIPLGVNILGYREEVDGENEIDGDPCRLSPAYAPYDDEALNREYRRSNGIPDD